MFKFVKKRGVAIALLGISGGVSLSILDDYVIYHQCTSKAVIQASENDAVKKALGEPISRGWWYNATIGLADKKRSVSCTFPVIGSHGSGSIQMKALYDKESSGFALLRSSDAKILWLEALLPPENGEVGQMVRVNLLTDSKSIKNPDCLPCRVSNSSNLKGK